MTNKNSSKPLTFLGVDPEKVLEEARQQGLEVDSVEDFRAVEDYKVIENLMDLYIAKYTRYSAIGGSTAGIGGPFASVIFGGIEVMSTAILLYQLSQRLALLNGLDPADPLQQDKARNIYLQALGFKTATQTVVKLILLGTSVYNDKSEDSKLISVIKRLSGQPKK